jgi:hypothetical protein
MPRSTLKKTEVICIVCITFAKWNGELWSSNSAEMRKRISRLLLSLQTVIPEQALLCYQSDTHICIYIFIHPYIGVYIHAINIQIHTYINTQSYWCWLKLRVSTRWLHEVLNFPVGGSANSSLSVVGCHHYYENLRTSWNMHFVFFQYFCDSFYYAFIM